MLTKRTQINDDFGDIISIATFNYFLVEIVADCYTLEDGEEEPDVTERLDGSYLIESKFSLEEIRDLLDLDPLPNENHGKNNPLWGVTTAEVKDSLDKPRLELKLFSARHARSEVYWF